MLAHGILIRRLESNDSLEDLTDLLHRAYGRLAEMGFAFVASHQDVETTRARVSNGECLVASDGERLVGTITVYQPGVRTQCDWYRKTGVAAFGQFAVDPRLQGNGVGRALLQAAEALAVEMGATHLALDTAAPATHLIELYERMGFRAIEEVQWNVTNYRSVVMSKRLTSLP